LERYLHNLNHLACCIVFEMHRKRPSSTDRRLRIPFVRRIHNVKERELLQS
jgi:hypothetical protein